MKRINCNLLLIFLSIVFTQSVLADENQKILGVYVKGATANIGQTIVSLFDSPKHYLKKPLMEKKVPVNNQGEVYLEFKGLTPGEYAVSVFYDRDNNEKMNTGLFGIPTELVGFSNNARGRFGPPSFAKTSFDFSTSTTIFIDLAKAK